MIEKHIEEIKHLQSQGLSTAEIARKLNIHPPSLYAYFFNHRDIFPVTRRYRKVSKEDSLKMYIEYFMYGLTQREIALRHDASLDTVRRHLKKQIKLHTS